MKFAEHLSAHITPEWRKQYIQYEAFKEMLYTAQDQAPSLEGNGFSCNSSDEQSWLLQLLTAKPNICNPIYGSFTDLPVSYHSKIKLKVKRREYISLEGKM
ncbi:hypothetical protein scyTo_0008249 [Scyliorhinus torazame]|uniref:SPX domain-containing protein n=1 Tax=Scyliorhinus torazame TaxID=75743 RepID=A0A401P642_SCYTO|nr:hypothetical protein [Scyliorhinus torazame]